MKKNQSTQHSLSVISLAVMTLISGCGGGGGGSASPAPAPTVPTVTAPVVATTPAPAPLLNVLDPSNAIAAHAQGIIGTGVTVGVVDTDFDVSSSQFAGRIHKTFYGAAGGDGNTHGTEVSEMLGGSTLGIAPGVFIEAAASGTSGNSLILTSQIYQDLFAKGVKIVNQSNGTGSITTPGTTGAALHALFQPYVAQNGLFIWSAGNDGSAQPSLDAGLPAIYPDLKTGWIAVVAVNAVGGSDGYARADTTPGIISSYSNRCGIAADWCLAATGDFASNVAGGRVYGTSFSAPAVTGAAALVQQAYPWMNADLIRQTILSTATDMHDRATYGWGLLNASKAVNGPALFDTRLALGAYVNVNFDTVSSVFKNDIGGDAGLIKSGSGQLTLAGNNTYSGDNSILGGILNITGSVASTVNVSAAGQLAGNGGRVHGNVVNAGRVNNTGAGLTIVGNYTASASATLANQLNSTLKVGGSAALGNSHLVATTPAGNSDPSGYVTAQAGSTGKVLTAGGGVSGQFGDLAFEADGATFVPGTFITATLSYTPNEVDLRIARNDIPSFSASAFGKDATRTNAAVNVETALKAADKMVASGATGGANGVFLASAAALQKTADVAAAAQVLDSLSGQIHASAQALTFQQSQAVNRDLSNRLSLLGQQSSGADQSGLWVSALGASGKLSETGFAHGDTSLWGGQFGVDTHLNERTIVGAAIAYSDGQASFDRLAGQSKSHNTGLSLYGRYALANDGVYVSGRAGLATVASTVTRTALVGNQVDSLSAEHTDNVWSAYGETGYAIKLSDSTRITPFAGIAYDRVKRDGFTENGSVFGLTADSKTYHQTTALLGLRGDAGFHWSGGNSVLQAYAAVQHAFTDGSLDLTAAFSGAPDARFTVQGIGLSRTSGWAGVGISTEVDRRWGWYANYDAQFGKGGLGNNVVSAGIRISFQ
ncbi:autotransporter domain-containing protein [Paraherbaspirillum soli]|uniref:Autotransporter domain-containing protein n=1 Tax=Paraherbaspirillum soli TaxID=631222 RepID=A0ABW0MEE6_9BURK